MRSSASCPVAVVAELFLPLRSFISSAVDINKRPKLEGELADLNVEKWVAAAVWKLA